MVRFDSVRQEYTLFVKETTKRMNGTSVKRNQLNSTKAHSSSPSSSSSSAAAEEEGDIVMNNHHHGKQKNIIAIISCDTRDHDELENSLFSNDKGERLGHEDEEEKEHDDDEYIEHILRRLCETNNDNETQADNTDGDETRALDGKEEKEKREQGKENDDKLDDDTHPGRTTKIDIEVLEEDEQRRKDRAFSMTSIDEHDEGREDTAGASMERVKSILKRVPTLSISNTKKSRVIALRRNRATLPNISPQQKLLHQNKMIPENEISKLQEYCDFSLKEGKEIKKDAVEIVVQERRNDIEDDEATNGPGYYNKDKYEVTMQEQGQDSNFKNSNSTYSHLKELEKLRDEEQPLVFLCKSHTTHADLTFMGRLNPSIRTQSNEARLGASLEMQLRKQNTSDKARANEDQQEQTQMSTAENLKEDIAIDNGTPYETRYHDSSSCIEWGGGQGKSTEKRVFNIQSMDSIETSLASTKTMKISNRRIFFSSPFGKQEGNRRRSGIPM